MVDRPLVERHQWKLWLDELPGARREFLTAIGRERPRFLAASVDAALPAPFSALLARRYVQRTQLGTIAVYERRGA